MKTFKFIPVIFVLALFFNTSDYAKTTESSEELFFSADSINLMVEFSLFHEDHKNNLFQSALPHGWNVINTNPTQFIKYKIFPKMEEILFFMHDSIAQTEEERQMYADTLLYLYDKAVKFDPKREARYLIKKAYVLEVWKDAPPEVVVKAYEDALAKDPNADSFYKDRFGIYLANHANDDNDYKLKALELYSKLSEQEPDNPVWISRIENLAENQEELVEITRKSWYLDKENLEKAYKYANMCLRTKNYEAAIEPLEFLISKSPDVINYWKQIAQAYDKLDQTDKAINAYKSLIELQPENRENYINLALIYKKMDQLSIARSYLYKASKADPDWAYPYYIEGTLYEQAARNCGFEFEDKCVYLLAVNTYKKAVAKGGTFGTQAAERVKALSTSVPTAEDYFFRKMKSGDEIKIEGRCYGWIQRSVYVP